MEGGRFFRLCGFVFCLVAAIVARLAGSFRTAGAAPLADVLTVCASGCDYASIQAAIDDASPGDVIQLSAEIYTERLDIGKRITLQGAGERQTIIQSASSPAASFGRVINVRAGTAVTITQMTIRYGKANGSYGGGIYSRGALLVRDVIASGNSADRGGGVACVGGSCRIQAATIDGNEARFWGGGLFVRTRRLTAGVFTLAI